MTKKPVETYYNSPTVVLLDWCPKCAERAPMAALATTDLGGSGNTKAFNTVEEYNRLSDYVSKSCEK